MSVTLPLPVYAQRSAASASEAWWAVVGMGGVLILAWGITRLIARPMLAQLRAQEQAAVAADVAVAGPSADSSLTMPGSGPRHDPGPDSGQEPVLAAGLVRVELLTRRALVGDQQISLTSTEFDLLRYLLQHQGQALSRADLLREVWGHQQLVYSRTVDTHVQRLRDKLGASREQLETVRGVGYRLNAPVVA